MSKRRGIIGVCWAKKVTDWEGAWKTGPATVGLQNCKESSFYTCISYIWYAWSTSQPWKKWPGKSWNERESHRKRKTEKTLLPPEIQLKGTEMSGFTWQEIELLHNDGIKWENPQMLYKVKGQKMLKKFVCLINCKRIETKSSSFICLLFNPLSL